jgi:hypothetical protein
MSVSIKNFFMMPKRCMKIWGISNFFMLPNSESLSKIKVRKAHIRTMSNDSKAVNNETNKDRSWTLEKNVFNHRKVYPTNWPLSVNVCLVEFHLFVQFTKIFAKLLSNVTDLLHRFWGYLISSTEKTISRGLYLFSEGDTHSMEIWHFSTGLISLLLILNVNISKAKTEGNDRDG